MVVLEAMAAGIPVIFTDRGCLRETVPDGEAGMVVPIGDPQQLANRLLWLLDHPEKMKTMGTYGRKRYESLYTKARHIERMIDVIASSCKEDFV